MKNAQIIYILALNMKLRKRIYFENHNHRVVNDFLTTKQK